MLHHADIMNPNGNDECGNGDITPNTTEPEPTPFTYETHEVGMGAKNWHLPMVIKLLTHLCPLHPQPEQEIQRT
eukprot:7348790-Karenia_brevis.AAC.1